MRKVLYIGGFEMPDGNAAAQRVLGVAKILRECDCEVHFLGLSRKNDNLEGNIDGFYYKNFKYPYSMTSWLSYLMGGNRFTDEIASYTPDIVILYNHPAVAIERIASYCHKRSIKVLADITEWYVPQGNPIFKVIKRLDVNRRMYKSHLKLDGLICISRYLCDFYKSRGSKCVLIPPTVDISQSKWSQVFYQSESIKIIYAGSPGTSKDRLDLVIKGLNVILCKIANKVEFEIIGITKEQYIDTWGNSKIPECVHFNGRISHNEVIARLLEADFQILFRPDNLPNRAGFPTKFVETITSQTIPITNLSSNLEDYLRDGVNGIVISDVNQEAIQTALLRSLSMNRSEIDLIKQSIDRDTFDFRHFVQSLSNFIS